LINATAETKANQLISQSITQTLVQYKAIDKWDGKLPQVSSDNIPFININK